MNARCWVAGVLFLAAEMGAAQTTKTVGQGGGYDYATIQAAIDAATTSDVVVVYPGTYWENINFRGKNFVLRSTNPADPAIVAATIIYGYGYLSVVTFNGNESSSGVLSGFTITHGLADEYGGGGICGNGARTTIQNNVITSNVVRTGFDFPYAGGGGLDRCNGLIQNNIISGNSASGKYGATGGGLNGCTGVIQNNVIFNNSAIAREVLYWSGGFSYGDAAGGGLFDCGALLNNIIYGNSTLGAGTSRGSGIYECRRSIRNCIVWANKRARSGGWWWFDGQIEASTTPLFCCVQGGAAGTGNISLDPLLADPAHWDFHLVNSSPCIDAGGTVTLTVDFEGNLRPYVYTLLPRGDGSHIDIGADEVAPRLAFAPVALVNGARTGTDASTQALEVYNAGGGTMSYTVETTPSWLVADPSGGTSNGPSSRTLHQINYQTASLPPGAYAGAIRITAPGALFSPSNVPVRLTIGSLLVLTPGGGEQWNAGSRQQVTWESVGPVTTVSIYLIRPGLSRRLATTTTLEGVHNAWIGLPLELAPAGDYRIRIAMDASPDAIADESEAFGILPPPTFTAIWPTTGTAWQAGALGNLTIRCTNLPAPSAVFVELWKSGGNRRVASFGRMSCQNGDNVASVRLPVTVPSGPGYQLRMFWAESTGVNSWGGKFTVTAAPTFAIRWPRAGSLWQAGRTADLTFTCANFPAPGQAYVELWRNGVKVRALGPVACRNGNNSVPLKLPSNLAAGPDYQIRLFWAQGAALGGTSEKFTVIGATVRLGVARFELYR